MEVKFHGYGYIFPFNSVFNLKMDTKDYIQVYYDEFRGNSLRGHGPWL